MNGQMTASMRPAVAVLCQDTLAVMGLRQLLLDVMPAMEVEQFATVDELKHAGPERFFHYFVYVGILLSDRNFFVENKRKTIVLTTTAEQAAQLSDFHCLQVTLPEKALVRALLSLEQSAHRGGAHIPKGMPSAVADMATAPVPNKNLSVREIDVLRLVVKGLINKEIADRLNISLTTVITHRKNITEKLGVKSVSALTIHAVMNGYVDIAEI